MSSKTIVINCPQCGGEVDQEDARDGICTCPFCKNTFYVEDIIKQPKINITHNTTTNTYYGGNIRPDDIKLNIGGQNIHIGNPMNIVNDILSGEPIRHEEPKFSSEEERKKYEEEHGYWTAPDYDGNSVYIAPTSPKLRKVYRGIAIVFVILMISFFGALYLYGDTEYKTTKTESKQQEVVKTAEKVDLSNILQIEFADGSSYANGKASIQYRWLDDNYSDIKLKARPKDNLSTGDVVHISVDDLGSHSEDEFETLEWDWIFNLMVFEEME